MRRAEVAVHALLHVAAFLRGDDQHFIPMKPRHAANDGGVVAKAAVAVYLTEIGEDPFNVIERLWALRMPRQFGLLPRCRRSIHLSSEGLNAILQSTDLAASSIVGVRRPELGDLALDLLQLLLGFFSGCHSNSSIQIQAIMRTLPRPHNCSTRAMKLRSGRTL